MTCEGWVFIYAVLTCTVPIPTVTAGATFCQIYKPVYWSKNDTRETKEQIDSNNKVWKRLCNKKQAQPPGDGK